MPEIVNGIPVPEDTDPVDLPGDLQAFATALGDVLAAAHDTAIEDATTAGQTAGAAAAEAFVVQDVSEQLDAVLPAKIEDPDDPVGNTLRASFGRLTSTDGTVLTGLGELPEPTGVGVELVFTADGLDDIRINGVSA